MRMIIKHRWSYSFLIFAVSLIFGGNGNDGEFVGGVTWVKGKYGSGLKFNGSSTKAISSTSNGVGKTAFTECLWVQFDNLSVENQFGYIGSSGTPNARYFYFSSWSSAGAPNDCLHCGTLDSGGNWGRGISTGRIFKTGQWYFVAGVIDTKAGFIKVYVDGALVQETGITPGDTPGTPKEIWVGATPENYQWLAGTADDIVFFNVALSEAELNSIMKNGISKGVAVDPADKLPIAWARVKAQ